jgi:protein involved in polysaccharide export with SLBB domain
MDKVYIIRLNKDRTKTHITVNLVAILEDNGHIDNILLQEYDIIRVLSIDDFDDNFSVSVLGAVRAAGEFDFGVGMTLQDVLLQAGGLTQQAEGSRVEVSRIMDYDISSNKLKPRMTVIKTIKIGDDLVLSAEAEEFILQPFDQIFVRENPNFEPAKNIVLSGEVKYPGIYTLLSKDEKISSLIKRAGGLTRYAYLDGVTMFRKEVVSRIQNTNITLKDLSQELLDSIYSNPNLSLLYQEEMQKMKVENFESFKAIIMYNKVYLNLDKALQSNESKHNLVLLEGDSVIVPKTMDFVHISGELMNLEGGAISAPYFGTRRANYYVNNFAGGFTKINKKANTVVIYPNGIAKKTMNFGLFVISPRVKKGSVIKVVNKIDKLKHEKVPIDWNKAIEKTMLKVTAILSLWLLVDRVVPAQ